MEFERPPQELMALADAMTAALVLLATDEQRETLHRLFLTAAQDAVPKYGPRAGAYLEIAAEFIRQRSVSAHLLDKSPPSA